MKIVFLRIHVILVLFHEAAHKVERQKQKCRKYGDENARYLGKQVLEKSQNF